MSDMDYKKEAKASHERKLKSYGKDEKHEGKAKTWAGFDALNTNEQRGLKPLDKEPELSKETAPRIMRKAGGRVHGADSLKRLDKSPRKAKAMGGSRVGPIPTPQEQEDRYAARAKGGKLSAEEFEGTAKDEREDKKLAKKHHMSMGEWEKSSLDKKHDRQQSAEGLKKGGRAKRAEGGMLGDGAPAEVQGSGSKKNGKTTVNVIIGAPKAVDMGGAPGGAPPMGAGGPPPGMPPMGPPPGAGGPPPGMPPMGGAPGGMPPMGGAPGGMPPMGGMPPKPPMGGMPMMRADGGKVQVPYKKAGRKDGYLAMDFGAGSGFGRKQKKDAYGEPPIKSKNNY